jgi:hypothetical protein
MGRRNRKVLGSFGLVLFVITASAQAAVVIPVPPSLNPGDTYRLIFVTNGTTGATSTDISTYNTFATNQANLQPLLSTLSASWVIVGGTKEGANAGGVTAATNVGTSTAPVYDLLGQLVGNSMPAIFTATSINQPITTDQFGNTYLGGVATGTADNGGSQNRPLGTNTKGQTRVGSTFESSSNWISSFNDTTASMNYPIYALSSDLTVPSLASVPEPTTVVVWGVALVAVAFSAKRLQRLAA